MEYVKEFVQLKLMKYMKRKAEMLQYQDAGYALDLEMCPYEDCLEVEMAGKTVLISRNWLESTDNK